VTFRIAGGQTHLGRVRPGAARGQAVRRLQVPAPHLTKVGDACTVRFPKASAYPFFCQVHYAQGMKGVLTVRPA
jgi:plastocyanin